MVDACGAGQNLQNGQNFAWVGGCGREENGEYMNTYILNSKVTCYLPSDT